MTGTPYAELHCHTNFSFLDGASDADELVERAVELGLRGLAITDHRGLYGAVRFVSAAEAVGLHPVVGIEIELRDPLVADPGGVVVPARRRHRRRGEVAAEPGVGDGRPMRPRAARTRLPGHREPVKEDLRGIGERQRGPHLVLLARETIGYRSLCRLVSHANLAGTKSMPRFSQTLLAENTEGLVALSGGPDGEIGRRLRVGDREGARAAAEGYARRFGGFYLELQHHLLPDDDWLVAETAALAAELGLPVVVTNDVHYARPEGRELHDVLTAIRHGRMLDTLADLRRPDGESYLKRGDELAAMPPSSDPAVAAAWAEGLANSVELAASCSVDLGFEQYRFPGFPVPSGETPFSYLSSLCWEGARKRYHPLTSAVVNRLAHELDVIERAGLAEFFLICWDLMRFAKEQGIPAQGRGSATSSIVSYTLGISRVEPIQHNLLFERFINAGRTTYPDVDIDFSSERREEVIQYVYERYGEEHTGMVCNLVTYRARSAVREVGNALGFPRPLVDRVAKALETYDSVMVRRDLEADGGFAEFFKRPGELPPPVPTEARGLTDAMGQLRHDRGGRIATGGADEHGDGRLARREDAARSSSATGSPRSEAEAPDAIDPRTDLGAQLVDGLGQLNTRVPLVGKVPPWRQPPKPVDPSAPRPFAWLRNTPLGADAGTVDQLRTRRGVDAPDPLPDPEPGRVHARISDPTAGQMPPEASSTHLVRKRHADPGTWDGAPDSPPSIRPGGHADDEGGPGDTPASVAWLRAGRGTGYGAGPRTMGAAVPAAVVTEGLPGHGEGSNVAGGGHLGLETAESTHEIAPVRPAGAADEAVREIGNPPLTTPGVIDGRRIKSSDRWRRGAPPRTSEGSVADQGVHSSVAGIESEPPPRRTDRLGRPNHWDPPAPGPAAMGRSGDRSSVARIEPEAPPQPRGGSTKDLSDWERWLEFCARIDGFPRHLSIHSGGMLVTAAPLIDIAPLERATMPGRVVAQYDKRDVETLKLIKLDLLGLGMLAAIDETIQLIEHDCGLCLDLDRLPEEIPEVFAMLQAADTVGVFQVESRAQMQTLPKSRPQSLDDLVVEVAIIRPGPIQGNAVHPYLRRKQGLEPVTYLHPSLEPVLRDSLGVILYQEQVMRIAIEVCGFTPAGSDAFRRAMGTWRSTREMEKLHVEFVEGAIAKHQMPRDDAEELFRQCAAFASFGFAKSHAAAFARTAYESSFLKLFYPAQFLVGLINAQPMGFYPVEVLVNDAKRHGVTVLPIDVNASSYKTTTEWLGRPGWVLAGEAGDDGSHDGDAGEPLPDGCGVDAYASPVRSPACLIPSAAARDRWAAENAPGWAVRLGLSLVKGIGEQHEVLLDAELARGPYAGLTDVVERTGLPEEVIERLIRVGALDSLGRPRRELLWQLREVAGTRTVKARATGKAAGRPIGLRLPATEAPPLPGLTETERLGDAYAVSGLDARRQAVSLFRESLDRLGVITNADLATHRPGPVRIGGLVVTRQHPMTARGTVFLALEDETGMANVTLWPDIWARWRGAVRRHALLLIDGDLQRQGSVVNVVAREVRSLVEVAREAGGPIQPDGIRQLGHAGMRRLG